MAANPAMIVRIVTELEEFKRNLAEGRNQIETTTAAMQKMATSFSGDKLIQHAHNVAAAVNQIGGASKLTEAEQARVNATVGKALEKYAVLGKEAPTALRQLHEATKPLPAVNESWWSSFTKTASAYIAGIATFETAKRVFGALVDFVKSSIASYASAEAAQQKLTVAVQANGRAAPEVIQQYGKLASAFQRTTAFSDDLITEMQALLVQVGGVMPSQMKRALQASTDLAAGLGIDLRVATLAVGKAFAGETGSLSRYGIVINDAQIKAQGMTAVLDAIHARFGGQATAQLETYTGRVAAFGNAWDNIKEQLGGTILQGPILEALLRRVSAAGQAGAESADQGAVSWARFSLAIGAGPAQASVIAFLEDYADTMNEIARSHERATRIPSPFEKWAEQRAVIPGLTAGLALAEKAFADTQKQEQEAKKAAEAHAKALEALRDRFSGEGVLKQARDYEIVLGRVGGASKLTREETEGFRKAFNELIEKYRLMGPAGAATVAHFEALREKVAPLRVEMTKATMDWTAYLGALEKAHGKNLLAQESIGLIEARMKATGMQVKTGSQLFNELGQHIAGVPLPLSVLTAGFRSNQQALDDIIDSLPKLDVLMVENVSKWTTGAGKFNEALGKLGPMFVQMSQIAGDSMSETVRWMGTLVSSMQMANQAGQQLKAGGLENITAGAIGAAAAFQQATAGTSGWKTVLGGAATGAQTLGAIMPGLGHAIGAAAGAAAGFIKNLFGINSEAKKVNDMRDAFIAAHGGLHALNVKAVEAGMTLDTLLRVSKVKDFEAAVQQLTGTIASQAALNQEAHARLQEAITRYKFTIEELGPALQRQRLSEQAEQLFTDFGLLVAAGIEVETVGTRMADSVNEYLRVALVTGQEVPAAMRPMLERMAEMGLLTDASGESLTDLTQIPWAETMTQGFDRVVAKLDELVRALARDIPGAVERATDALGGIGSALDDLPRDVTIPIHFAFDEMPEVPSFAEGTRGRFLDFGSGTPAVLHGRERVVTERESIRETSLSTAALEAEFQALRRELRRDFPRAVGIAVQDAIVLAR